MELLGYPVFQRTVLQLTGINLDQYKGTQMERRLLAMLRRTAVPDLLAYARLIQVSPGKLKEFQDFLTINVSEWFRNPEKFDELKLRILPSLFHGRSDPLRIWSAGCSSGCEPYSIALILDELGQGGTHEILATDLDEEILKVARTARFAAKDLRNVSALRLRKYFLADGDRFEVRPEIRERVVFRRHNLLSDPFPQKLDLIICRNVVIYFADDAKDELYRRFRESLRSDGILFVGGTESLLRARELGFMSISPFFYRVGPKGEGAAQICD